MNESTPYWGSDEDFRIVSEAGVERMRVTASASTTVTNRVAGRVVIASDGVFTDNGTVLSPLGGGGGATDPLTVGPVKLGTAANGVNNDGVVIGAGAAQTGPEVMIFAPGTTTPITQVGSRLDTTGYAGILVGNRASGSYAMLDRDPAGFSELNLYDSSGNSIYGSADGLSAQMDLVSGNAEVFAKARSGGETFIWVRCGATAGSTSFVKMDKSLTDPTAETTTARIFVRDNGAGKLQFCARFPTGAIQVIATEP